MGNPKQKWTSEEEEALRKGVLKHGTGKWKDIQRDPEFNPFLLNRSNIDLKDKWRNLSCSANGQGPREKSRSSKSKANSEASPAAQSPQVPLLLGASSGSASAPPAPRDAVMNNADEASKAVLPDGKNSSVYNSMIFEAISTMKEPNGSDTSAIVNFIERKHEVPQNFRRLLSTRLRRLVAQDKLEKFHNSYKLKTEAGASSGPKTPAPRLENPTRPLQSLIPKSPIDPLEEAAIAAAYKIAEAENRSFVAAEAVKEAERIAAMAEEADSMLLLAEEIYEKCLTGEYVLPPA